MEKLKNKLNSFEKIYVALEHAIDTQMRLAEQANADPYLEHALMTNVVKHFELAYETGCKFLKQYLYVMHNLDIGPPKDIFQACLKQEILPEAIINQLILLANTRNLTAYIYDQIIAQEVNSDIDQHYAVLGKILELVKLPEEN